MSVRPVRPVPRPAPRCRRPTPRRSRRLRPLWSRSLPSSRLPSRRPARRRGPRSCPAATASAPTGASSRSGCARADPTKVVFFLQGGGACFDAGSCSFTDGVFSPTADETDNPGLEPAGIFDDSRPDNPFAGWSVVFVPYCTGDVHLGDAVHQYSPELTVHHKGAVNGRAAVSYLADNFPDAEQVVVVGESAGSVASPIYGGLVADALPNAAVTVLGDGSGGYPDSPASPARERAVGHAERPAGVARWTRIDRRGVDRTRAVGAGRTAPPRDRDVPLRLRLRRRPRCSSPLSPASTARS